MNDLYTNIPNELKTDGYFCYWKLDNDRGKIPYNPIFGTLAKSNDIRTFSNYMLFCKYTKNIEFDNKTCGIGLGIFNGFSAIDIDNCIDSNGNLSDMANDIIRYCNSYTEYSPSGKGIRIIFKTNSKIQKEHYYIQNHNIGLEIYVSNNTNKFVTLTGNIYKDKKEINLIDLEYILKKYMAKQLSVGDKKGYETIATPINNLDWDTILVKDSKLHQLWFAVPSGSGGNESEMDLALCAKIAYYTGGDREKVNRMFMTSPYYSHKDDAHKAKWEIREDYRQATINKACANVVNSNGEIIKPEKSDLFTKGTDRGDAELFVEMFGNDYRYNVENKKWMYWNGSYWQFDTKNQIYDCFNILAKNLERELITISDEEKRKEFVKNIKKLYTKSAMDNILDLAATMDFMPVVNAQFDSNPYYLNTEDGLLDLKSNTFVDNNRLQYISMSTRCGVSYEPPVKFLRFLDNLALGDELLIDYLHRALGYSLLGKIREPYIYLLYGNGRNGKSLLLSVIRQVLGDYSGTLESGALVENRYQNIDRGQIALLVHKRFIVSEETKETDRLNEKLIKNLTSAGELEGKVLYGNPFKFRMEGKLFSSTNHLPKITGADDGIWRRIKIIPCDYKVTDKTDNLNLEAELLTEKEKILGWLIMGCLEYQSRGLYDVPSRMSQSLTDYQEDMNIIREWIDECCEVNDRYQTKARDLFKSFDNWRNERKEPVMSENSFGRRLVKQFKRYQTSNGKYYVGIKIKGLEKDVAKELAYQQAEVDYDSI